MKGFSRFILILSFLLLMLLSGCISKTSNQTYEKVTVENRTTEVTPTQSITSAYSVDFSEPVVIGHTRVIVMFALSSLSGNKTLPDFDVQLLSDQTLAPTFIETVDNHVYAIFDGLNPDRTYTVTVTVADARLNDELTFTTPPQTIRTNDVSRLIQGELKNQDLNDENQLLLETQACLKLLDLETDPYGTFGFLTQASILRLEYSFNAINTSTAMTQIYGGPTEDLLEILKGIISVSGLGSGEQWVRPFEPESYALTDYAKQVLCEQNFDAFCSECDNFCGKIDVDRYIYELSKTDSTVYASYLDRPFIPESDEFKKKYAETRLSKTAAENQAAANKAIFALNQRDWLTAVSVPQNKVIPVAGTVDDSAAANTLIALSYMTIDGYRETGQVFFVRSGYRTFHEQELIFYQVMHQANIDYWRDLSWYKQRQKVAAVPGFSNHQFGIAIDFEGKFNGGISSFIKEQPELYRFLLNNGRDYGFYRNSSEPWHWAYLGKTFDW